MTAFRELSSQTIGLFNSRHFYFLLKSTGVTNNISHGPDSFKWPSKTWSSVYNSRTLKLKLLSFYFTPELDLVSKFLPKFLK